MLVAALEFRERVFGVAEVHHQHVVGDINVQMFFGQSEKSSRTFHVSHHAVGVCCAFKEQLARSEQQVELVSQHLFAVLVRLCHI